MKSKFFTNILTAAVIASISVVPAFATTSISHVGSDPVSTHQEYEDKENGTHTTEVTAKIQSKYRVAIPAKIVLNNEAGDENFSGEYQVSAMGNIAGNQYVTIAPDASFEMTGATTNAKSTASVTQAKTVWRNVPADGQLKLERSFTPADGKVDIVLDQADAYSGGLKFTFSLTTEGEEASNSQGGTQETESAGDNTDASSTDDAANNASTEGASGNEENTEP